MAEAGSKERAIVAPSEAGRPDLFISYAREETAFVRKLDAALRARGKDVWVDWEDILPSADWQQKITAGIEAATVFVVVLTPELVASHACRDELACAVASNKRIVPILRRELDRAAAPLELTAPNWLFCREGDDFEHFVDQLVETLGTDLEWLDEHAHLLVRASEWQREDRDASFLLRGSELRAAEDWLARQAEHAQTATPLQTDYLLASRRAGNRRQRLTLAAVLAALIVALALAAFAFLQRSEAIASQHVATSRQLAAQADLTSRSNPLLSINLSLAAFESAHTTEARAALLHQIQLRDGIRHLLATKAPVEGVAFSPDGRSLAAGGKDGEVVLWDVATGKRRMTLTGPVDVSLGREAVSNIAFSPDGRTLAAGFGSFGKFSYAGDRVLLWNVATGKQAASFPVYGWSVAFSPDGRTLASGGEEVVLWDVATRKARRTFADHLGENPDVTFSPDGRTLASAGGNGWLTLWDVATGTRRRILTRAVGFGPPSLSFSPDGRVLALGQERQVTLWDVRTGKKRTTLSRRGWFAPVPVFSPDGRTLAVGSGDGEVSLWNVASSKKEAAFNAHVRAVNSLAFSPNGRTLASGGDDARVILWDLIGRSGPIPPRRRQIETLRFSPDGRTLALAELSSREGTQGVVVLWDLDRRRRRAMLATGGSEVQGLAFSPDGRSVAAGGEHNRIVTIWDAATGTKRTTLSVGCCHVESLSFSRDGHTLAVANLDDGVALWDLAGHTKTRALPAEPRSVAFSRDGRILASGGSGEGQRGEIVEWDAASGKRRETLTTDAEIWDIAFSPDGRTLVSGDDDGSVILWDVATGRRRATLTGANGAVSVVAFSKDGRSVAALDANGSVLLWDVDDRLLLGRLFTHAEPVSTIAFGPDGHQLAAGAGDGQLVFEDVQPSSWRRRLCSMIVRGFTALEWKQFSPHRPPQRICS